MSIFGAIKAATGLTKLGVAMVPVLLTLSIPLAWKVSGKAGETRGYNSRDVEVTGYTDKIATLEQDLLNCTTERDDAKDDVSDLNKKMAAQADAHASASNAQAATARAAQRATNQAMTLLAESGKDRNAYFENLAGDLKGLSYDVDENGACIVRGGGNLLRRASKGKTEHTANPTKDN